MSKIVYGVFDQFNDADAAVEHIDRDKGGTGTSAFVHNDHLHSEDLQVGSTLALRGAIAGGLLVGLLGAIGAGIFLLPGKFGFGLAEFMFICVGGSIFGVVGGAVSGASEARKPILKAAEEVERGKSVVTVDCEMEGIAPKLVMNRFREHGAVEVEAA